MKTVIAAFRDHSVADNATTQLRGRAHDVRLIEPSNHATLMSDLRDYQIPDERAQIYAEVLRRGATLVVLEADDHDAPQIAAELDRMGSLDLDAAASRWRTSGWRGYDANARELDDDARTRELADLDRDSISVVQEDVQIGKREVQNEGVRVRTFVTERPVREDVQLREEHVRVEREKVNEPIPLDTADSTFTEDEFVVTATSEEAVVGKQARVVERVRVDKEADVRTESVEETERRRDVEVERIDPRTDPRR